MNTKWAKQEMQKPRTTQRNNSETCLEKSDYEEEGAGGGRMAYGRVQ